VLVNVSHLSGLWGLLHEG